MGIFLCINISSKGFYSRDLFYLLRAALIVTRIELVSKFAGAMFYAFKYCVALSCLYAFNYINCFILVAEGPYSLIIIRLKFRFLLTRLTGF